MQLVKCFYKPRLCWCVKQWVFCLCSMNGALAFVDTSDCTMMNIAEHYTASDVEWDPTGRYIVTSVSWWSHKVLVHFSSPPLPALPVLLERAVDWEENLNSCHWLNDFPQF